MTGSCTDFARELLQWYTRYRRRLPWRARRPGGRVHAWAVLVSELMLQQTQVATVIPYFHRFMRRFPTPGHLAAAPQRTVLRMWQGLGYYSRARHLHAASRRIVADFQGVIPASVSSLRTLPGVGRYTAGAVASIAYELRAPILDGNVARVLCRLEKIRSPWGPRRTARLWRVAEQILPDKRVGDFNSALMDLGATICTTRSPRCEVCPVRAFCKAAAAGMQDRIPVPRKRKPIPVLYRWTICVRRGNRWLLEQRPAAGRWAGMWQFITIEAQGCEGPNCAMLGRHLGRRVTDLHAVGQVRQALTHRRYLFDVFTAVADGQASAKTKATGRWVKLADLDGYPLPAAHVRIAAMLKRQPSAGSRPRLSN